MLTVRVKINIASQTTPQIIPVVQGDTGRSILFEIADFVIPAQATATYFIKKPSGHAVYNSATIDRNTVLANLTAQSIAEVGENPGQVRIIKNDEVVTSFDFILDVEPFRGIDAIESTTEMNIFDKAVQQALEEIDGSLNNIVAEEFDAANSYLAGEYVLKDGAFYKFTTNHTGAWSTSDVEETTIGEELANGGGGGGAVDSVNGQTGTVVLDAGDLGYDDEETYTSGTVGKEITDLKGGLTDIQTATSGDIGKALSPKTVSSGKVTEWQYVATGGGSADLNYVTPEEYGAEGDGITDDSAAVQDAVDAGYAVYFGSNKTYYIPTPIEIDHDIHLYGGENSKIVTNTPTGGTLNDIFVIEGTLKATTTLTTDYTSRGSTDNSGNQFTLSDMSDAEIGDIMVITATDQYYNYSRAYYYLGATLLIGDKYGGHLYTTSSMPWDIENTANVSVEIYNAPSVIIENLHFEADNESGGNYKYLINLSKCKNVIIKNCDLLHFDSGINLDMCVNTLIESVSLAKSKETNDQVGDGYGIYIGSCSDTIIQRIDAICAQSCVALGGTIPNMNTYIRNCDIGSECRPNAVGMHENSYNLVIEDCTLTGLNVLGTGIVNRCRFIKNNRSSSDGGITFCGSHNPDWAVLKVNDCIFEDSNGVYLYNSTVQQPVQAFDNIIGLVTVTDCKGGLLSYEGRTSAATLSNVIKELRLIRWTNCYEIYHPNTADIIERLSVVDCTFTRNYWINDHNHYALALTNVYDVDFRTTFPMQHKVSVNKATHGDHYTLPENVSIQLSATNSTTAKYVVCGNNLASNEPDDYEVGTVTGSDGGTLTRTPSTSSSRPTLTTDSDGNLVHLQNGTSGTYDVYPVGLFYAREDGIIKMSAKLKNTGGTSGATFRPLIAIVNCDTGKLISRYSGTAVQATAEGATISYTHDISKNCIAMCYFYCNSPVANSETTFADYIVYIENMFAPYTVQNIMPYEGKRRTGDGSILSLSGVNNVMSSEMDFHVAFQADYIDNPIGLLPSGSGVSF